jgi:hypothetical protein
VGIQTAFWEVADETGSADPQDGSKETGAPYIAVVCIGDEGQRCAGPAAIGVHLEGSPSDCRIAQAIGAAEHAA